MFGEATTWFTVGALGMGVGTLIFLWGTVQAATETRKYYLTLTAISGIAAVAYALMALEFGWTGVDDRTVFLPRYVDWLLTTPLLLLYLGMLVDAPRVILAKLLTVNVIVIVTGFAAALLPGTERFLLFALGSVAYIGVLYYLLVPLTRRARGRATESLYLSLRNLTFILWSVYPIIWLLGPPGFNYLTLLVDVLLITYLDLVTKVGFGLIAINASAALSVELGDQATEAMAGD